MDNRIRSLELMRRLQPFVRNGLLTPSDARETVTRYQKGDTTLVAAICNRMDIPVCFNGLLGEIRQFCQ